MGQFPPQGELPHLFFGILHCEFSGSGLRGGPGPSTQDCDLLCLLMALWSIGFQLFSHEEHGECVGLRWVPLYILSC